ncbi:unnamed protein product [Gulo gulo]|uniref:Uncharacterized protein n=1 Tax=Gulo gulo TaxID=48420 RepID=A0A9X9PU19_GULGU|nr:unnamed protein product [Gulo gulo]
MPLVIDLGFKGGVADPGTPEPAVLS